MMRPSSRSPRSVILTTTERLLVQLTTLTTEPKGRVGWQAVMAYMLNRSPLAVLRPLKTPPYQEAMPFKRPARLALAVSGAMGCAALKSGVGVSTGAGEGAIAGGLESRASACTVGVERVTATATRAIEEAPARRPIPYCVFRLMLREFLRITIPQFY